MHSSFGRLAAAPSRRGAAAPSRRAGGVRIAGLAIALALSLAATALAGVVKGATYSGRTSKPGSEAVTFKVSANGKKVLGFKTRIGYNGKCGQGGGPSYEVSAAAMTIGRDGSFKGTGTGRLGSLAPVKIKIAGRIKGRNASGTVEQPTAFHCNTPPHLGANAYSETFTARAK